MTPPPNTTERDHDLFSPSLTQVERRELPPGQKPWRLGSQFYIAFFGGPLAAGAIGYLNGKRLGLPQGRLAAILAIGVAGFLAGLAAAVALVDADAGRGPRLMLAVAGVASFVATRQLQKDADRLYTVNRDEKQAYDSLWARGLGTVLLFGILSLAVMGAVT